MQRKHHNNKVQSTFLPVRHIDSSGHATDLLLWHLRLIENVPTAAKLLSVPVLEVNNSDKTDLQCPRSFVLSFHVCIIDVSLGISNDVNPLLTYCYNAPMVTFKLPKGIARLNIYAHPYEVMYSIQCTRHKVSSTLYWIQIRLQLMSGKNYTKT